MKATPETAGTRLDKRRLDEIQGEVATVSSAAGFLEHKGHVINLLPIEERSVAILHLREFDLGDRGSARSTDIFAPRGIGTARVQKHVHVHAQIVFKKPKPELRPL